MKPLNSTHKVYFLSLEDHLPKWYPLMEEYFKELKVSLILTHFEEIKQLSQLSRIHVIVSESTLSSKKKFDRQMKDYLGFAVQSNLLCIHHISSFMIRRTFIELRNRKPYYFYKMPFSIASFCWHLLEDFLKDSREKRVWPGGKRAKLPPMGLY